MSQILLTLKESFTVTVILCESGWVWHFASAPGRRNGDGVLWSLEQKIFPPGLPMTVVSLGGQGARVLVASVGRSPQRGAGRAGLPPLPLTLGLVPLP